MIQETAGWHADPSGRFVQRYYDGSRWTDHVVSARGDLVADALPEGDTPLLPPRPVAASAQGMPPPPRQHVAVPQPAPSYAAPAPPAGRASYRTGWEALAVGGLGLLLLVLSLLALPWSDAEDSGFLDASKRFRDAGSDLVGDDLLYPYVAGGAFALLALTAVLVVLSCLPMAPGLVGTVRVVGAGVAGLGAILHGYLLHESHVGDYSPGVVPWLGLAGFVVAGLAMVLGARRRS